MPEEPRALRGAAIVTGGASGLGAACAERLHAEGMGVLVADRDAERGEALAQRLGERAAFAATDVTDAAAVEAAVAAARRRWKVPRRLTAMTWPIWPS